MEEWDWSMARRAKFDAAPLNAENGSAAAEVINAAYGIVQGVYGGTDMLSDAGHREWCKPETQAAAMRAAEKFISDLKQQK